MKQETQSEQGSSELRCYFYLLVRCWRKREGGDGREPKREKEKKKVNMLRLFSSFCYFFNNIRSSVKEKGSSVKKKKKVDIIS